jgi:uncharacterized protein YndB with AHSA1/START domain
MIRTIALAWLAAASAPALAASPVSEQVRVEIDGTTTLSHEVVIAAGAHELWVAISTIDGWKTWAVPVGWVSVDRPNVFETSYDPNAQPGDAMNIKNEFISSIPRRELVFRTIKAPEGFPHFDALRQVNQKFELTPEGNGTRVRLTGTGYANDEPGKAVLAFFRGGNKATLEMLRDRFENGPIDWSEKLKKPLK